MYSSLQLVDKVLEVFEEMKEKGISPSNDTYQHILRLVPVVVVCLLCNHKLHSTMNKTLMCAYFQAYKKKSVFIGTKVSIRFVISVSGM